MVCRTVGRSRQLLSAEISWKCRYILSLLVYSSAIRSFTGQHSAYLILMICCLPAYMFTSTLVCLVPF
ncbi:hypothetical protein CS542_09425 [Pedobacter sp. IW39]|nr:hypothetical protein CS542_09425 [Pedobacter sp. IW39]